MHGFSHASDVTGHNVVPRPAVVRLRCRTSELNLRPVKWQVQVMHVPRCEVRTYRMQMRRVLGRFPAHAQHIYSLCDVMLASDCLSTFGLLRDDRMLMPSPAIGDQNQ
uniref:Uncharacterized protein n=1 Tax=Hyaloperonospora arabidopsidis (strain Emoy2) TaxID=559515 RepID=M4BE59_HYAAE